jgi:hypothetical protein
MLLMGGDVDPIPRPQFHYPALKLEAGGTLEHHHPLTLGLVVPKAVGRFVSRADDPFDPDAVSLLKDRGEFFWQVRREIGEEVHGGKHQVQEVLVRTPPRAPYESASYDGVVSRSKAGAVGDFKRSCLFRRVSLNELLGCGNRKLCSKATC